MPYFDNYDDEFEAVDTTVTDTISADVYRAKATDQSQYDFNIFQDMGYSVGGAVTDFVDMVGSSIPGVSKTFGLERGDFNNYMTRSVGLPGMAEFYEQNKGGLEIASGVAGIIASELVAKKITKPGGMIMTQLRKTPYLRRIAAIDDQYESALNTVKALDRTLAGRGAVGIAQANGVGKVEAMVWSGAEGMMVPGVVTSSRIGAVNRAKGLGFVRGARNAAVTEAVMATTMNQNGFLYDDSASYNIMMGALGLGVGGAADWLHSAYRIRKGVNDDVIRREFAGALDPNSEEASRIRGIFSGNKHVDLETIDMFQGANTDRVTQIGGQINSLRTGSLDQADDAKALSNTRDSLITQLTNQRRETLQKTTTKGISSDGRTRFSLDAPGYGNHADMMLHRDDNAMYLIEQLGGVPDDMTSHTVIKNHSKRLADDKDYITRRMDEMIAKSQESGKGFTKKETLEFEKLQLKMKRLEFSAEHTPLVAIDGEWMPPSAAAAIEGFQGTKVLPTNLEDGRFILESDAEHRAQRVALNSEFELTLPGAKTMESADHYDVLRAYRVGNDAIKRLAASAEPLVLPKNPTWFQLDMAEQVLKANPNARVQFPGGLTRESAQVESFIQKGIALRKAADKGLTKAQIKAGETTESMMAKLRVRYNLPKLTAYEIGVTGNTETSFEFLMRGMDNYSPDELRKMTLAEIKDGVAQTKRLHDMVDVTGHDVESLSGNSFTYMLDESGKELKPLIGFRRPAKPMEWTKDHLADRLAARKLVAVQAMMAPEAGELSNMLAKSVLGSSDYQLASRPDELMETMIQGSITGASHQTQFGAFTKELKTSEHNFRDAPTLLGAARLRDTVERMTRDMMTRDIDEAFGDTLGLLANPHNKSSKVLLDQFHSIRQGWDLEKAPVKGEAGFWHFKLGSTEGNRNRWKATRGTDMPEGALLESVDGRKIVLDDLGLQAQAAFNKVTDKLLKEKNTLLRAHGRAEVRSQNHFVPVPEIEGRYIGFIMGPDNKVVPDMTVIAESESEFAKLRAEAIERAGQLPGGGMGYTFRTQDQIRDFMDIWDRADMDMISPGTTAIQPGKKAKGALVGSDIRVGSFEDSLKHLQNQYAQHGRDVIRTLMKDQINSAEARSQISRNLSRNKGNEVAYRNVHDYYLQELLGKSKIDNPASIIGQTTRGIEQKIDRFLAQGHKSAVGAWDLVEGWLNRVDPRDSSAAARSAFDKLSGILGEHMPFKDAFDMAERTQAGSVPPTVASMANKLNKLTASLMLRWGEVGQPIMNMAGIFNAMPAVIRQFEPRVGESAADFASRVGHHATIFDVGGEKIATLDMVKMGKRGFERAWNRTSHADYDYMVRRGYLSQEVAEFQRAFGVIEQKGKFKQGLEQLDKYAGILSDKSEDFSRSWGHMIGLEMADVLKIEGLETRHMFAHDVANKMIANYSPHNRPEVFQGGLGAPIGLFQSFIVNYYERMFRAIETKDVRTLATQLAVQTGLFGATGLPGFSALNEYVKAASGGERDMQTGVHGAFSDGPGSILAHGVLSSLPKLFGMGGVDLYGRGETSFRVPGVGDSSLPGVSVATKIIGGIAEGFKSFMDENPGMTRTRAAEILSNMVVNRPLAGTIEQFAAHGNDVDAYGQLVTTTKGWAEMTYRVMGLRSERQSMEVAAFYGDKQAQEDKASRDEMLRNQTRAAMREGRDDLIPGIFEKYVQNGGDPRYFRRWWKSNLEAATESRSERRLETLMDNPANFSRAMRMIDMGVGIQDDEEVGDTTEKYGSPDGFADDPLSQPDYAQPDYEGQVTMDPGADPYAY